MTGKALPSGQLIDSTCRAAVSIVVIAAVGRSIPPNYQPVVDARLTEGAHQLDFNAANPGRWTN